ncbi:1-deoxy-D-xylulose-5-phosphate reductoisomerase [Paenibacillus jamilae]|jgi:1-deoxy-D-xylulose-5-phosphate reductoisomerase|uniref:1-deoxy-D-xylulose-5-phosphate reductoisomerase n=1 Tax=Paenibacillus TaxID=44249 RepID=UPI000D2FBF6D|nr:MULTISPECIES: 1-deoxy-D-xylulose-5-phosphate reductoisomerase [Paenibacillus]MDP9677024.1 1-deoxy-D-xylulose-5-phosphate reductoisomerase [Paenibacillus jamilae]KAF6616879.1 1-deoxy-D-xylulose-5-phosphate reductoisomerase [Paenibacillus sp. EKM101P]KAF6621830.1 1-deoxy-D-xylulose-5-phosphate reductoisomerase [Paenibacillus sp. EKM102P]KAF6630417.1 1-deoxy-D-xylulose-5-phosphate reductoisomerase [Paenibacillus sp. EKM10P]KAF6645671.1 1-deoxy-D-xylulose-5-phosphate reductoisomerase [Paenibaci
MKRITVLGSTGSIGTQTLDVVSMHPDQFTVEALAGGSNIKLLAEQARLYHPKKVSVGTQQLADEIRPLLPSGIELHWGNEGLVELAANTEADMVVTAVMGSVGLHSTLAAIEAGKQIGLANKETLVTAGHLVTARARAKGVPLLPIDSEHSAIFQCLNGERMKDVAHITLTASGGSFRDLTREQLREVTVKDALKHPNWSMGAKITIDSATMVNKGLEVIEAHWLFGLSYEQIHVLLHPESIIHSYVEFQDTSIVAQLGNPDMRVPIQYALTYPERMKSPAKPLSLAEVGKLHFKEMDFNRFPCLRLAFECGKMGGTAPTAFNAANEIAVARFLRGEISFLHIEAIIEQVLEQHVNMADPDLSAIETCDRETRSKASKL